MKYQISITGYIGSWTKRMVHDILNDNKGKHVDVSIDSLGGEASAGLSICQMFKSHGDVTVDFQAGFSASAATICAMGANKIRMSKYTLLLVHKCSTEQFVWSALNEEEIGSLIEQLQKQQENQQKIDNIIANVYCDRSGKNHEDIIKVMSEARWHTVDECIELGFVDEVMDGKPAEITEQANLRTDIGLSSLDLMSVASDMENTFGVKIPERAILTAKTVKDLIACVG